MLVVWICWCLSPPVVIVRRAASCNTLLHFPREWQPFKVILQETHNQQTQLLPKCSHIELALARDTPSQQTREMSMLIEVWAEEEPRCRRMLDCQNDRDQSTADHALHILQDRVLL